jgi:hypothetical protein
MTTTTMQRRLTTIPSCEATCAFHLPNSEWTNENNLCNPRDRYYPTPSSSCDRYAELLQYSPHDGHAWFDTMHSPRWQWRNSSSLPTTTFSFMTTGQARYARQTSLTRHYIPRSLPAWIYLQRRAAISATLSTFASGHGLLAARTHARAKRITVRK